MYSALAKNNHPLAILLFPCSKNGKFMCSIIHHSQSQYVGLKSPNVHLSGLALITRQQGTIKRIALPVFPMEITLSTFYLGAIKVCTREFCLFRGHCRSDRPRKIYHERMSPGRYDKSPDPSASHASTYDYIRQFCRSTHRTDPVIASDRGALFIHFPLVNLFVPVC